MNVTHICNYLSLFFIQSILVLGLLITPLPSQAQIPDLGIPTNLVGISLTVSPRYPKPESTVTIRAESFSIDLNRSRISWRINGETMREELGLTEFSLEVGQVGEPTEVEVTATASSGLTYTQTVVLQPASVDIIAEPVAYTPPFYKGKALLPIGGSVRLIAIANIKDTSGNIIPPQDLVFTWKQGARVLGNLSGRGKDTITLPGHAQPKDITARVEIESADKTVATAGQITVPVSSPQMLFYENHPTLGIRYERAINASTALSSEELTLVAEPYYFSTERRDDADLAYTWRLNNAPVTNPSNNPSFITLRPSSAGGTAQLSLLLSNNQYILQSSRSSTELNFSEARGNNFFNDL